MIKLRDLKNAELWNWISSYWGTKFVRKKKEDEYNKDQIKNNSFLFLYLQTEFFTVKPKVLSTSYI